MEQNYDLAIIGGGPAGYTAAIEAAKHGFKTALIEKDRLGGTCLQRGCIPTKTILHSVSLYAGAKREREKGIFDGEIHFHMERLQEHKRNIILQLQEGISTLMKKNRVQVVAGTGMLSDRHTVLVKGEKEKKLSAEKVLIAAGSRTVIPKIPGHDLKNVFTSSELLEKEEILPTLTIIGGGVIGMEFAAIYSGLGCQVTVLEFMDRILGNMDREISQNLKMIMKKRGVEIHTGAKVEEIKEKPDGKLACVYREKEEKRESVSDGVLLAAGRRPAAEGLFTQEIFLETDRGRILTDENGQTSITGIYAAGDVTGGSMLAHAASAQAVNAVCHMAGMPPLMDLSYIPGCVYTEPEIASIGLNQDEAKKRGIEVLVKKYPMSGNGKTVLSGEERGFIKVIAERESHRILGAQMMCARATDMISQFSAAAVNGWSLEDLGRIVYPHPTFSEGIGEAVRD